MGKNVSNKQTSIFKQQLTDHYPVLYKIDNNEIVVSETGNDVVSNIKTIN